MRRLSDRRDARRVPGRRASPQGAAGGAELGRRKPHTPHDSCRPGTQRVYPSSPPAFGAQGPATAAGRSLQAPPPKIHHLNLTARRAIPRQRRSRTPALPPPPGRPSPAGRPGGSAGAGLALRTSSPCPGPRGGPTAPPRLRLTCCLRKARGPVDSVCPQQTASGLCVRA